jgi:hypothetical protein
MLWVLDRLENAALCSQEAQVLDVSGRTLLHDDRRRVRCADTLADAIGGLLLIGEVRDGVIPAREEDGHVRIGRSGIEAGRPAERTAHRLRRRARDEGGLRRIASEVERHGAPFEKRPM